MPNFTFKCEFGHIRTEFHHGLVPERSVCAAPGCTAGAYRMFSKDNLPQTLRRHRDRVDGPEYREDLARFKGDPRAIVTGPRSLAKLIDTTRREVEEKGGIVRPVSEASPDSAPDPIEEAGEEDLLKESYLDAINELNS